MQLYLHMDKQEVEKHIQWKVTNIKVYKMVNLHKPNLKVAILKELYPDQ